MEGVVRKWTPSEERYFQVDTIRHLLTLGQWNIVTMLFAGFGDYFRLQ